MRSILIYLNSKHTCWQIVKPNPKFFNANDGALARLASDLTNGNHYGYKIM